MPRPRKPRPMKWHVFLGRRGIDVPAWLTELKIRSYDALVSWCEASNVEPPERDDVKGWFGVKKQQPPQKKPKSLKPPRQEAPVPAEQREEKSTNKSDDVT